MEGYTKSELLYALKAKCEWIRENVSEYDAMVLKQYGIELIEDLRDISQERGEWLECGPMLLACSNCGKVIGCPITNAPDYCQNCGARMNGGEYPENDEIDEIDEWFYS